MPPERRPLSRPFPCEPKARLAPWRLGLRVRERGPWRTGGSCPEGGSPGASAGRRQGMGCLHGAQCAVLPPMGCLHGAQCAMLPPSGCLHGAQCALLPPMGCLHGTQCAMLPPMGCLHGAQCAVLPPMGCLHGAQCFLPAAASRPPSHACTSTKSPAMHPPSISPAPPPFLAAARAAPLAPPVVYAGLPTPAHNAQLMVTRPPRPSRRQWRCQSQIEPSRSCTHGFGRDGGRASLAACVGGSGWLPAWGRPNAWRCPSIIRGQGGERVGARAAHGAIRHTIRLWRTVQRTPPMSTGVAPQPPSPCRLTGAAT